MIKKESMSLVSDREGRFDQIFSTLSDTPRSIFSKDTTECFVNSKDAKKSSKVKIGDILEANWIEEYFDNLEKSDVDLEEIYEDDDILVINKRQGLVVHPGAGVYENTIVNGLLYKYGDDFSEDGDLRPGIVHRLDKDTSGVMVIAKNRETLEKLQEDFRERRVKKTYYAIVKGEMNESFGRIEKRIERDRRDRKRFKATDSNVRGKSAITEYKVLSSKNGYSFLEISLLTGRTHQIRVHMKSLNHPVLGDSIYSQQDKRFRDATLMLHSGRLSFTHPRTGEAMDFATPLPDRMKSILNELEIKEML